jgi:RNA polymerase sigma-70 factor (ECF subfamily)
MASDSDRYVIERCLDGHRDDFRHLVERYQRPLVAGMRARRVGPEEAEEAAQEAFVRAFERLATLRKPDSFFSWLLGIGYHVLDEAADHKRRERAGLARAAAESRTASEGPADRSGDADLERALSGLAAPLREVILLRFYGDFSCGEMAERLGVPLGTVTKRLSRAYEELRTRLAAGAPRQE